jgi:acyl-CoA dehydrogenase
VAVDFTFPSEVTEARATVRDFLAKEVAPVEEQARNEQWDRDAYRRAIGELREKARAAGVWLPHMPEEYGGMGLGLTAMAAVSAEASKVPMGPYVINCQAPDEGNMHTLLHWATDDQKERYLKPLCEGTVRSCFAMTEPEVAGSDPTLIQTRARLEGDEWVIDGHKWFISGAEGAGFAILIARTEDDPEVPQAANTAFLVDLPAEGWTMVRDIETMSGSHNHCEIDIRGLRVPDANRLGGRGQGHRLGQARLGPARLTHCMRWIGQAEEALERMIWWADNRYSHGSMLSQKQGIQWMISDSVLELYQSKLMVLHAAYRIERGDDFRQEVSMAKYHVANMLWNVVDRAVQVHGAAGYSEDTPLAGMLKAARWARLADGADEVHKMRIAELAIRAMRRDGHVTNALGDLPV